LKEKTVKNILKTQLDFSFKFFERVLKEFQEERKRGNLILDRSALKDQILSLFVSQTIKQSQRRICCDINQKTHFFKLAEMG